MSLDFQSSIRVFHFSKPMMDLLIKICSSNHLSPSDHTLQIFSNDSDSYIGYKPSQTLASLNVSRVKLVPKKTDKSQMKVSTAPCQQMFEVSFHLTLILPIIPCWPGLGLIILPIILCWPGLGLIILPIILCWPGLGLIILPIILCWPVPQESWESCDLMSMLAKVDWFILMIL